MGEAFQALYGDSNRILFPDQIRPGGIQARFGFAHFDDGSRTRFQEGAGLIPYFIQQISPAARDPFIGLGGQDLKIGLRYLKDQLLFGGRHRIFAGSDLGPGGAQCNPVPAADDRLNQCDAVIAAGIGRVDGLCRETGNIDLVAAYTRIGSYFGQKRGFGQRAGGFVCLQQGSPGRVPGWRPMPAGKW